MTVGVLCHLSVFLPIPDAYSVQRHYLPVMEYASHVWGGFIHTAPINRVESKAFHLINYSLTDYSISQMLLECCISNFYRYFHGYCSSELAHCMTLPLLQPRCTRPSTFSHPYSILLTNARVTQHFHSFIHFTGKLWSSLLDSVFPPNYDLNSFKRGSSRYLHD